MRKFVLAAVAVVFSVGLALAAEVSFVKFDKDAKKITVKEGDKESTYLITDDTKVIMIDKEGKESEGKVDGFLKRLEKAKEGSKFDITAKDGKVTAVKVKGGKK